MARRYRAASWRARINWAAGALLLLALVVQVGVADAQEMKTLKVGLLTPVTGNVAASGQEMLNAWNLWWEQNGNVVGNIRVETRHYDTASDPGTALTRAREAVDRDGVHVLVGPLLASEALAIAPFAESRRIPLLSPVASADDLSQRQRSPYFLKVAGWSSSQPAHPAGQWAYDQGYRRAVTIAADYAFGHENTGGFSRTFVDAGGKIIAHLFFPFGATDFSPFFGRIFSLRPDVVFAQALGGESIPFLTQWRDFGLRDTVPLITNETLVDQSNIRRADPDLLNGILSFGRYAEGRNDPMTREFVRLYGERHKQIPGYYGAALYTAGQWLTEALKLVDDPTDPSKLIAAIRSVELENSVFGPQRLDEYGGNVQNVYLRRMVPTPPEFRAYGAMWNEVVEVFPNVSQFWTYDPEEFLADPVYSNVYQGY